MSPKLGVKRTRKLKRPYSPTHFTISDDCDDSDDAARTVGQSDNLSLVRAYVIDMENNV